MIAAFDVHYFGTGRASAAGILFRDYTDPEPVVEFSARTEAFSHYIPGQFYKRELPCILNLLERISERPQEMIVDGYVMLGHRPGLGYYLFEAFHGLIPVIGVAKSRYHDCDALEIFRGASKRPLYVTSAGVNLHDALKRIRSMHGPYRVPALLKRVDFLARKNSVVPAGSAP